MERVLAGNKARELFAMLHGEEVDSHFWHVLSGLVAAKVGKVLAEPEKEVPPMNDAQAHEFEQHTMPFGKYQCQRIVDLEASYLSNLTDPNPFLTQVKRYVAWRIKRFPE